MSINLLKCRLRGLAAGQRMLELCAFVLCLFYPLCPDEVIFGKLPVRLFLLVLCLSMTSLALFLFRLQKSFTFTRGAYRFDIWIAVIGLCLVFRLAYGICQGRSVETEVFCLAAAGMYYLFSYYRKLPGYLMDALLFSGGLFLLLRVISGFRGGDMGFFSALYENREAQDMAVLLSVIASAGFCTQCRGWKSGFYMTTAVFGFAAILMEGNLFVNLAFLSVLFVLPLCFPATAANMKRGIAICFAFLFLWSNMSLLEVYIPKLKEMTVYTLEDSIYLDLLLCAAGLWLVQFWERIPRGSDHNRILMTGLKKRWISLCVGAGGFLVFLLSAGLTHGDNLLKGRVGEEMWSRFHGSLQTAGQRLDGLPQTILRNFGIAGMVFVFVLILMIITLIRRQSGLGYQEKQRTAVYIAACLWMLLFIAPSPETVPYMILFVTALLPGEKVTVPSG